MRQTAKMGVMVLAAIFASSVASAALEQPVSSTTKTDNGLNDADGQTLVCRRINPYARTSDRICATSDEWKAYHRYVNNAQTRGRNNPWGLTGGY